MTERLPDLTRIQNVLIRSANWIGDAVMTTPAVAVLRSNLPQARISLMARPVVAPVFEKSPHIDRIIVYDKATVHCGIRGKLRLAAQLREERFDLALLFQNAFEAALISFLARIPRRIGYKTDGRALLLTDAIPRVHVGQDLHQIDYYLSLIAAIGLKPGMADPGLYISPAEKQAADERLKGEGLEPGALVVGINPSTAYGPAKEWFPERYAALADRISDQTGAHILIFGGPQDRPLGERVAEMMQYAPLNLAGRTTLREAMALIDACRLFVSNDSGLMHVAAALKIPLIALFGSTDPEATGPRSPQSRVLRIPLECSPCLKRRCPLGHMECMRRIEVEAVFNAAREFLA